VRVCVLPATIDAAGAYRLFFPLRELKAEGFEMVMPPMRAHRKGFELNIEFLDLDTSLLELDADVYVFQLPLDKTSLVLTRILHARGKTVVCETDDGTHCLPHYNPAYAGTNPAVSPDRNRDWMLKTYREADAMSVATPALADLYDDVNDNITVVPNYLDWNMWEDVTPQYEVERRRLRVGYMGIAHWHSGDLKVLRGVLGPWLRRHPEVEFVAAGDPTMHDFLDVPQEQRVSVAAVDFRNGDLADITAVMDIGLVPLEMNRFNECKSALKGMEYAACGIPCVASPTASYQTWLESGDTGFLARRTKDWLRALEVLVGDDDLRREMGRNARRKAEQHSIQHHVDEWHDFYRSVGADTHAPRTIRVAA
jgi:glycosyltransferase involved in cell wall biosynthesis